MERRILSDALDLFEQCACLSASAHQLRMLLVFICLSVTTVSLYLSAVDSTDLYVYAWVH